MNVPIIRLEVEGMKYTIQTALMEHTALVDASIQEAVEAYCTDDNINAVVQREVNLALERALKEEVQNFFGFSGAGRAAVREAVLEALNKRYPAD